MNKYTYGDPKPGELFKSDHGSCLVFLIREFKALSAKVYKFYNVKTGRCLFLTESEVERYLKKICTLT